MSNFRDPKTMAEQIEIRDLIEEIRMTDDLTKPFHTPEAQKAMSDLEEIFKNASLETRSNKDLVLKVLEYDINCLEYVPEELKKDLEIQERALKTLKNYKIQEILNLIDFDKDVFGEASVTPNMRTIESIVKSHDFKIEERYPQNTLYLTKGKYDNDFPNDRPKGKEVLLQTIPEYKEEMNKEELDFSGGIFEPGKPNEIPDKEYTKNEIEEKITLDF